MAGKVADMMSPQEWNDGSINKEVKNTGSKCWKLSRQKKKF